MVLWFGLVRGAFSGLVSVPGLRTDAGRLRLPFPTRRLGLRIRPPHIPCGDVLEAIWYFRFRRRENIFRKNHLYGEKGGCATILTHGHTKSAHISHIFSETPYRVARDLLLRRATLSRPQGPCTALQGEAPETPPRAQGEPSYPVEVVQGRWCYRASAAVATTEAVWGRPTLYRDCRVCLPRWVLTCCPAAQPSTRPSNQLQGRQRAPAGGGNKGQTAEAIHRSGWSWKMGRLHRADVLHHCYIALILLHINFYHANQQSPRLLCLITT